MNDLTHGLGAGRNFHCTKCGTHFYDKVESMFSDKIVFSKWFDKKQWFFYINDREERTDDF